MAIFCATCNAEHPPRPPGFNRSPRWIRLSRILTVEGVTSSSGHERFFCEACELKLEAAIAVVAEMAAGNTVELETIQRLEKRIVQLEEMLAVHRRNEARRFGTPPADIEVRRDPAVVAIVAGSSINIGDPLAYDATGAVHRSPLERSRMVAMSAGGMGDQIYVRVGEPPPRSSPRSQPPPSPPRRR